MDESMKFLFISLLALFTLTSCSLPRLSSNTKTLSLHYDDKTLSVDAPTLSTSKRYYPPVTLTQTIKRYKESFLTIDTYRCDTSYLFDRSMSYLLFSLYNPSSLAKIASKGNLYFFIIKKNNKTYNVIAQNSNKKSITFYYPVPNQAFTKLIHTLTKRQLQIQEVTPPLKEPLSLTEFSPKLLILNPLTKKVDGGKKK